MNTESDNDVAQQRRRQGSASQLTRRGFLGGLGIAGIAALTACAGRPAQGGTASPTELSLWTHDPGFITAFQNAVLDPAIMGAALGTVSVTPVTANGADLMSRAITQAVAGRQGPDLLGIIVQEFPRVMKSQMAENLFVDLSSLAAEADGTLLRTAPYSVDGKLYGLDSDASISVFYYREDEFRSLGIDPELATWEEYLEVGGRVFGDTGKSIGMVSNGDNQSIFNTYLQYLLQRGGSPFDEAGELTIDTEESADVLTFMRNGVENGSLMVLGDAYGAAAGAALSSGTLISTVTPNWYNVYGLQANAPDQAGAWRMRTIPRFRGGGHVASNLGGTAFAVGLNSPNRDTALDLLRRTYLTPEGQLLRYNAGGFLPTIEQLYDAPEFTGIQDEYLGGQRVFDVYRQAAKDLPAFYQASTMNQLRDAMGAPILALYAGTMDAAQAIAASTEAYKQQTRQPL